MIFPEENVASAIMIAGTSLIREPSSTVPPTSTPNSVRIKDPVIDEALDANRGETDPAAKQEYAETIARQFGAECYDLWRWYTQWGLPHRPEVKGLDGFVLPSGSPARLGAGISGTFNINAVWLDQ